MVEDVNESPELIGDTNISYLENGIDEVIEFTAEDPEGSAVTWASRGPTRVSSPSTLESCISAPRLTARCRPTKAKTTLTTSW